MIPDFERISSGFLVKDRKVFVIQRNEDKDNPLEWEFPGSRLKKEEKYDAALIRECDQEFQIKVNVIKEIGSAEVLQKEKVLIFMFFLIEGDYSKIKLVYHKDSKFVNFNELKSLDLCDSVKSFIQNYEIEIKEYID